MGMMVPEEWGGSGTGHGQLCPRDGGDLPRRCLVRGHHVGEQFAGLLRHQRVRDARTRRSAICAIWPPGRNWGPLRSRSRKPGAMRPTSEPIAVQRRRFLRSERDQELDHQRFDRRCCPGHGGDRPVKGGRRGSARSSWRKGRPGFTVAKKEKKLGIRSSDTVSLVISGLPRPGRQQDRRRRGRLQVRDEDAGGRADRDRRAGPRHRAGLP